MADRFLHIALLVVLILFGSLGVRGESGLMPRRELDELNKAIENSDYYRQQLLQSLDSMRRDARRTKDRDDAWRKYLEISAKYRLTNTDSAIHYAETAYRIAESNKNETQIIKSLLYLTNALSTAGIFTVAKSNYDVISKMKIPDELKVDYWQVGAMLYSYMMAEMGEQSPYAEETRMLYEQTCDSLMAKLPHSSPIYRRMKNDRMISEGRYAEARDAAEKLLSELSEGDRQYGLTAIQLAVICDFQGDERNYASYLARSAMSDVKASVTDGMALPALANWLYENDGLDDAYRYVNFALKEASTGSARKRTLAIAQLVPYIDSAYRKKIDSSRSQLIAGFIVVIVLLTATAFLAMILLRQKKRADASRKELSRISKVQESYVGNFIALCSSYANRLDYISQLVGRKLSSGQADELLKMVKSGKLDATTDDEDFSTLFDNAFLDMYPNFVANVNSLLRPDSQIELKDERVLTPELRIYAFVKLGVDESVKIAQILRYSVSTVYAYRNRMRNRAIDRENFDETVAKVGR